MTHIIDEADIAAARLQADAPAIPIPCATQIGWFSLYETL